MADMDIDGLCAWLRANDIDPGLVPHDARVDLAPDCLTIEMLDPRTGARWSVQRPILVQPPAIGEEWRT